MDMTTITAAMASAKALKDLLQAAAGLKVDNEVLGRINNALNEVSAIQEKLFEAREQLFTLQKDNEELRQQIKGHEDWKARLEGYALVQTAGGAVIYKSRGNAPTHFVCPSCIEKKAIQVLQDVQGGEFNCPACKTSYWTSR